MISSDHKIGIMAAVKGTNNYLDQLSGTIRSKFRPMRSDFELMTVDESVIGELDEDAFLCRICLDQLNVPMVTECLHRFCKECIGRHFRHYDEKKLTHKCPLCNMEIRSIRSVKPDANMAALFKLLHSKNDHIEDSSGCKSDFGHSELINAQMLHLRRREAMIERSSSMTKFSTNMTKFSTNMQTPHVTTYGTHQKSRPFLSHGQISSETRPQGKGSKRKLSETFVTAVGHATASDTIDVRERRSVHYKQKEISARNRIVMFRGQHSAGDLDVFGEKFHQLSSRCQLLLAVEFVEIIMLKNPKEESLGVLNQCYLRASADVSVAKLKLFLTQQSDVVMCNDLQGKATIVLEVALQECALENVNEVKIWNVKKESDFSIRKEKKSQMGVDACDENQLFPVTKLEEKKSFQLFRLANDATTLLQVMTWASLRNNAAPLRIYYRLASL